MAMTDEERFRFDLAGFFVRPAILTAAEVAAIRNQIERIGSDPTSLPPEHRALPGGPSSVLVDHPRVIDVLHEVIGPDIRLESLAGGTRVKGQNPGAPLHQGGPLLTDPLFGYRSQNGQIQAGSVRVIFELTDVSSEDGATVFLPGSHKSNFPIHADHSSIEPGKRGPFLMSYDCPAGSAIFFTEALCHGGQFWQRDEPRVVVFNFYSHVAINFHRVRIPVEVMASLPREKQAYFRQPWYADFNSSPAQLNTVARFAENDEVPMHLADPLPAGR